MSKRKLAVCVGVTSDLAFAACTTFKNFADLHGTENVDFFLFSDRPAKKGKRALQRLGIEISVVEYKPPLRWSELWKSRAIGYFSPLVLSKFEIFSLLKSHERAIWLDYDILIQQPLDQLTRDDFDIAYFEAFPSMSSQFIVPPLTVDGEKAGMSAGLIAVTESFSGFSEATSALYSLYRVHAENLYMPEQAIFDLYLSSRSPSLLRLNEEYCTHPNSTSAPSARVLHTSGTEKFWTTIYDVRWEKIYRELIDQGMPGWNPRKSKRKKLFRKIRYLLASTLSRYLKDGQ